MSEGGGNSSGSEAESSSMPKLIIRGLISNSLAIVLLSGIGWSLQLWRFSLVAVGIQLAVFFLHGLPNRSETFYDLSGSFTHFAVVATALMADTKLRSPRQLFAALVSVVWMTRLGTFLYSRILRDGKDGRFDALKGCWLTFMGAWTVQAVWVLLIQLPVLLLNDRDDVAPLGLFDALFICSWFAGFLCEAAADSQKSAFRDKTENKGKYITTGLWRYSRHPNYFGEILMWTSQAGLASVSALKLQDYSMLAAWLSPAFTALLLLKVTGIPMVEKAGAKKWGDDPMYQHYIENTNAVIPGPPAPQFSQKNKEN